MIYLLDVLMPRSAQMRIDDLFIKGTVIKFTLLDIGKYSIAFSLEPLGLIFLTMLAALWTPALLYTIKFFHYSKLLPVGDQFLKF